MAELLSNNLVRARRDYYHHLLLNVGGTLIIIATLLTIALSGFNQFRQKSAISEVYTNIGVYEKELSTVFVEKGYWPADGYLTHDSKYSGIDKIYFNGKGRIDVTLAPRLAKPPKNVISFRAAIAAEAPTTTILWVCGDATPPAGFRVFTENQTSLSPDLLTMVCRQQMKTSLTDRQSHSQHN